MFVSQNSPLMNVLTPPIDMAMRSQIKALGQHLPLSLPSRLVSSGRSDLILDEHGYKSREGNTTIDGEMLGIAEELLRKGNGYILVFHTLFTVEVIHVTS